MSLQSDRELVSYQASYEYLRFSEYTFILENKHCVKQRREKASRMNNFSYGVALLSVLLFSGCTTLNLPHQRPVIYHQQTWQQRYNNLSRLSKWNIDGTFSIQQSGKTTIAAYSWQQNSTHYHIRIHSLLGIYSINICGRPGKVTLWRSPQEHYTASTPQQLMQQQLNWKLPLSNLYYWIRGIHAPGVAYRVYVDTYAHVMKLQQSGWNIFFSQYTSIGSIDIPRVLQLSSNRLMVKIVIKHWNLP